MLFRIILASLLFAFASQLSSSADVKVLLRYDDYSNESNIEFERALFATAEAVGGSVLVGVIPFFHSEHPGREPHAVPDINLSADKIDLLRKYIARGVVTVADHGFNHQGGETDPPVSEFSGLSQADQSMVLTTAKRSLELATGQEVTAFIPPHNRYDADTLDAIRNSGYGFVSAGPLSPVSEGSHLRYLPGSTYPQKLDEVVDHAISSGDSDALVVIVLHPYDMLGNDAEMPAFRHSTPMRAEKFFDLLRDLKRSGDVTFTSINTLIQDGEDLSAKRVLQNRALRSNWINRYHLLPDFLGAHPLPGLYYSQAEIHQLRLEQTRLFTAFYGSVLLAAAIGMAMLARRSGRHGRSIALTSGIAAFACLLWLVAKLHSEGLFIHSALLAAACIGVLSGVVTFISKTSRRRATNAYTTA